MSIVRHVLFLSLSLIPALHSATATTVPEIGVLRNDDIHIVQPLLYPKLGQSELSCLVGAMSFDPYLVTPNIQVGYQMHLSEKLSVGAFVGGGYGLKTPTYLTLESPAYGVAPYAYRYLTSLVVGAEYAPIYAKMNLDGARIMHFDTYLGARLGATLEQSVILGGGYAVAPTLSLAVGMRFFLSPRSAIRIELRDDMLIERRMLTQSTHFKQNVNLLIGLSLLSPRKAK